MDTGDVSTGGEAPPADGTSIAKKMKKISAETSFSVDTYNKMSQEKYEQLFESEGLMSAQDNLQEATNVAKNELEGYVYSLRNKLFESYADFVKPDVRTALAADLDAMENWLYEDGEDEAKSVYEAKLVELRVKGDPIAQRYNESETRAAAALQLQNTCSRYAAFAESQDPQYAHIEAAERATVRTECSEAMQWLTDKMAQQQKLAKTDEPAVLSADILKKAGVVERVAFPIASKPAPKKEEPKVEAAPVVPEAGGAAPMEEEAAAGTAPAVPEVAPMDE